MRQPAMGTITPGLQRSPGFNFIEWYNARSVDASNGAFSVEVSLKSGAIDLYPEYTGTGLVSILGEPPAGGARRTLQRPIARTAVA